MHADNMEIKKFLEHKQYQKAGNRNRMAEQATKKQVKQQLGIIYNGNYALIMLFKNQF